MEFKYRDKYGKMTRALARLERIYTDTGDAISTAAAQDATEDFFNHAYHFKDFLKRDFVAKAKRIEEHVTRSRVLSLVADLHNSLKHAEDTSERRRQHETETGSPPVGDLVRINTHTKIDFGSTTARCSQRLEVTFQNATYDVYDLAKNTVREWDVFLAAEGMVLTL